MKTDLKEKMIMNDSLAFTRRQFLKTLGFAAMSVAGGAPVVAATGADPGAGLETPVELSSIVLKKHVGSTFLIQGPEGQIVAVLESVDEDRADDKLDQFTARFHLGRSVPGLNQDSYEITHDTLGKLSLLLSPGGKDGQTITAAFCNFKA